MKQYFSFSLLPPAPVASTLLNISMDLMTQCIMQTESHYIWLISLSMFARFIHVVAMSAFCALEGLNSIPSM